MSELSEHAQEYLRARRALGVKLERHGRLLPQLIDYVEAAGASTITRELAISWARPPTRAHPQHWAARLSVARGFAAYLQTIDPATEIPPAGVFAVRYQRPTPYLWSPQDVFRLLEATRSLRPPLKAASYEALFGLLAVTGMRLGEAIALAPGDVDIDDGVITIREHTAKLERARLIPLHPTTVKALERYTRTRAALCPKPRSSAFSSLHHRHEPKSQRGRKDAAHTHHRGWPADRNRSPPRPRAETQLRCQHPYRLAAPWHSDRRADRSAVHLPRARQPGGDLLVVRREALCRIPGAPGGTRRRFLGPMALPGSAR